MWVNFETSKRYVPLCSRAAWPSGLRLAGKAAIRDPLFLIQSAAMFEIPLFSPKTSNAIYRVSVSRHPRARLESTADVV
jgi:hypothetical protein